MPITALPPAMYCVSWFAVESIASFPSFTNNHAHPDPNRPRPAALNFSLNPAKEPKLELIAAARSPFGSPPPPFVFLFLRPASGELGWEEGMTLGALFVLARLLWPHKGELFSSLDSDAT